jgi:fused signal recognition particle receptor
MGDIDLTSTESIFFVVAIIATGIAASIFYYFLRFSFKEETPTVPIEESSQPAPELPLEPVPKAQPPPALYGETQSRIWGRIKRVFQTPLSDQEAFSQLEEVLLSSDLGPRTVQRLTETLDERLSGRDKRDVAKVREALRSEITDLLQIGDLSSGDDLALELRRLVTKQPTVMMVVGVNGAGKTTTIGKLAAAYAQLGFKVLVAAGDTFRAAAQAQLGVWADRAGVEVFSPSNVKDPAAVAYEAVVSARNRGMDIVLIDTAGRLPTQTHLMDELKKVRRVIGKLDVDAPHEVLLVLDASSGQNALAQAHQFHDTLGVTGLILTKMDGTAKGGVIVGLSYELKIPIYFIGVGEGGQDLKVFSPAEFVDGIFGDVEPTKLAKSEI